jgi:hypothetical protein
MVKQHIKSAERVRDLGEVFTPDFLVEQMLDQFPVDAWEPGKNWLEPTCGNGQFIIGVLRRKLAANNIAGLKPFTALMTALDTTFGTDIMHDNVSECRARIYKEIVLPYWKEHGVYSSRRTDQRLQVVCVVVNNITRTKDALKEDYSKFQHLRDLTDGMRERIVNGMEDILVAVDKGKAPENRVAKRIYSETISLRLYQ